MINARAEGIETKPSFKRPLRTQRCLLPASAFFEWQGVKRREDEVSHWAQGWRHVWAGGAVRRLEESSGYEVTTCTIITCAPNAVMAPIHNRMPVILLPEDEDAWLDPGYD